MSEMFERKGDFFDVRLLVTKATVIRLNAELVKDIIEASLAHTAAEHARMAMESYGNQRATDPVLEAWDIFHRMQTFSWDQILDRPWAALNDLKTGDGETFDHVPKDQGEYNKDRPVDEWERILGVPLNVPTFQQAVATYQEEKLKEVEDV